MTNGEGGAARPVPREGPGAPAHRGLVLLAVLAPGLRVLLQADASL